MNGKRGPGGWPDPVIEAWALRFNLSPAHILRKIRSAKICQQLSECKDDDARRLLLGVSQCT